MEATIDIRTADGNVNILLEDKQVYAIHEVLVDLCLSTMAVFSMLIDAAGRVVASGGEIKEFELEGIAALAAADLATTRQLAAMVGEPEFTLLFQHERQKNLFMTAVESDAILIVVFDVDTTFGALRLRIRRSISQLQQILHQARRSTVVALASAAEMTAAADMGSSVREAVPPLISAKPRGAVPVEAAPAAPRAGGLPDALVVDMRKALAWFDTFKGWAVVFSDEVEFLRRSLERQRPEEIDTIQSVMVRMRARLTEQKRLLEARFRLIQSLYHQLIVALQQVMQEVWKGELVDKAIRASFAGVSMENNMVNEGVQKRDNLWIIDFGIIGKQFVATCHVRNWTYQVGMMEMLRQLNGGLSALSAFSVENPRLREELVRQWARLYRHYSEGLKTLELEREVLELFRPLVRPGQMVNL